MKKFPFLFAVLFLSFYAQSQSEKYPTGLVFEDEVYDKLPQDKSAEGSKAILPPRVDLKPFCPPVPNQGELFSCVGWAVGYEALTMQRAIQNHCKDTRIIAHNASSALFIYNQINGGNCSQGSRMSDALEFLKQNGNCLARDFDSDINDCEKQPDLSLKTTALDFAIEDYLTLFSVNENPRIKVRKVKFALAQKKPVVIGMSVRRNFYQLKNATYWWPENGNTSPAGGHALTVIGYDDRKGAFQLINSWGPEWGNQGFIWVKYPDFARFCKYAYVMYLDSKDKASFKTQPQTQPQNQIQKPNQNLRQVQTQTQVENQVQPQIQPQNQIQKPDQNLSSNTVSKPTNKLGGNLNFRFVARRSSQTGAPFFQIAGAKFQGTHYTLNKKDWRVGQLFQLAVNEAKTGQYIYVFSLNQSGESKIHWPRNNAVSSANSKKNLLIPGENKALKISKPGKEYLVVLFSHEKVEALPQLIELLRKNTNDLPNALWEILGNRAVSKSDIQFEENKIGFESEKDGIVPVILEVRASSSVRRTETHR